LISLSIYRLAWTRNSRRFKTCVQPDFQGSGQPDRGSEEARSCRRPQKPSRPHFTTLRFPSGNNWAWKLAI